MFSRIVTRYPLWIAYFSFFYWGKSRVTLNIWVIVNTYIIYTPIFAWLLIFVEVVLSSRERVTQEYSSLNVYRELNSIKIIDARRDFFYVFISKQFPSRERRSCNIGAAVYRADFKINVATSEVVAKVNSSFLAAIWNFGDNCEIMKDIASTLCSKA